MESDTSSSNAPRVGILCIGNEVVDGRILNSNASWIAQELIHAGFLPQLVTTCRDDLSEITEVLTFLSKHVEFLITSGGLGPTTDDLTRQAISHFFDRPLVLSEEELGKLKNFYRKRGRKFDNANNIQAHFPENARVIPNPNGTAPGFIVSRDDTFSICSLPGVPRELHAMITETVLPFFLEQAGSRVCIPSFQELQLFGIPESEAGKRIDRLPLPNEIRVGYRPHFPELQVRVESPNGGEEPLKQAVMLIREELDEYVFSMQAETSLPQVVHELLSAHDTTLAVAESCTSGLLGKLLTDYSGASAYFSGGILSYSNELKEKLLGVPNELIQTHGAVSPQVARAMATGTRERCGSSIGVSITGVAGPNGGTTDKPVGLFYIGIASQGYEVALEFFLPTDRDYVRIYSAFSALDSIRRFLLGLPFLGKTVELP